ncbi:MAG: YscO family type III secretion system apparatus protein [Endozoicomonadaceae bacterium]|nr:YscO family type III secretion system apparatus protein [Endozoicomonadaceae bacterium]
MLHDLLHIKKIRERSARHEVQTCQYRVEQAHITVQEKEKALEDHVHFRTQEEKKLYDNIMNTSVTERALNLIKQRIIVMRNKDMEFEEAIQNAKNELDACKEALKTAKELHQKSIQMVEKFKEFTRIIDEKEAQEILRKEELELEEFSVKNRT